MGAPTPLAGAAGLDRLVHEPARLAILTALSACHSADFVFLMRLTALTQGNLGSHLARLEAARLVEIVKTVHDRRPLTTVVLTPEGARRIERHWVQLELLRSAGSACEPPDHASAGRDDDDLPVLSRSRAVR